MVETLRSDGSEDGNFRVADINPEGSSSSLRSNYSWRDTIFSAHNDNYGRELGNQTVQNQAPYASISAREQVVRIPSIHSFGEALFFNANDGTRGYELWKSDEQKKELFSWQTLSQTVTITAIHIAQTPIN